MKAITVRFADGRQCECSAGTEVGDLAEGAVDDAGIPYIAALVNNDVSSLSYPLTVNCEVKFLNVAESHGWHVYRRSLCFLLAKAVRDVFPGADFSVEHSFGLGLYCNFHEKDPSTGITAEKMAAIERRMHALIDRDVPIVRRKIGFADAVRQFEESGQEHKLHLLKYRNPPHIVIYECDGFFDLAHGPLAPRTGVLKTFRLIHYPPGFVLYLPNREDPMVLPPFEDQPHLFRIYQEHKEWGRILGVNTAGRLNEIISKGQFGDFIMTAEALHEKKLSQIADQIAARRSSIKLILIAGPSSAGKTTFAKRLRTHLTVNGLRPVTLGTDDYFVGAERNPKMPDGTPDYEHIEAVDLELFNKHLIDLIAGREILPAKFDFQRKQPGTSKDPMRLSEDQVLIIEGIHGLNPRLTSQVPAERKFKIYVSALTQLSIDSNNRISTTDNRLMRRMVRDHRYRGHSPLDTLKQWPSVRRGEETWIFPFQREADATFNSALDYELAVLKPLVEPLLMQVKPYDPEYAEARRLSEFLLSFLGANERLVPNNSILREYIGGSAFRY
jgi:uridine kinase